MALDKFVSERVRVDVDLKNRIRSGDSLTGTPTVTPRSESGGSAMTVVGNAAIVGTVVRVSLSGGGVGEHTVHITCDTSGGDKLAARPRMRVLDDS